MSEKNNWITLNDGNKIPQIGIGVFKIESNQKTEEACLEALKIGYRHIDTAHSYHNERGVGRAIKKCNLKREEIFVTSKLWPTEYGKDITLKAIDEMLERLQLDYLDLILLHIPASDYVEAWKELEKAKELGKVKSIGLSNFEGEVLEDILKVAKIKPAVIQVKCNPYFNQHEFKKKIAKDNILLEAWFPIGHGDPKLLNDPLFEKLGKKYNKSNVQVILRWHLQENNIFIPKSSNPAHIMDNFNIFDFQLTKEEMDEISKLKQEEPRNKERRGKKEEIPPVKIIDFTD